MNKNDIKDLENKVNENLNYFKNKIDGYNDKLREIQPQTNISNKESLFKKFNFNFGFGLNITKMFLPLVILFVCLSLYIRPNFICNKVVNEDTKFNEYKISLSKLILYSLIASIIISFIIFLVV